MEKLPSEAKHGTVVNFDFKLPTSKTDVLQWPTHTNVKSAGNDPLTGIICKQHFLQRD